MTRSFSKAAVWHRDRHMKREDDVKAQKEKTTLSGTSTGQGTLTMASKYQKEEEARKDSLLEPSESMAFLTSWFWTSRPRTVRPYICEVFSNPKFGMLLWLSWATKISCHFFCLINSPSAKLSQGGCPGSPGSVKSPIIYTQHSVPPSPS